MPLAPTPQGRLVLEAASGLCSAANCSIAQRLEQAGLQLEGVSSHEPSTLVASPL